MSVFIAGAGLWLPGSREPADLLADLNAGRTRTGQDVDKPGRPDSIAAGSWRRMSRLARMVIATSLPMLEGRSDLDTMSLVWGTCVGEIVPTARFLRRLITEGPQRASPLSFQNSVYNAPAGHLSIAVGLRGVSETVSAGGATGLAALLRGVDLIRSGRSDSVLVIAGDDRNETQSAAFNYVGHSGDPTDLVGATLITRAPTPIKLEVKIGEPPGGSLLFGRTNSLPQEGPLRTRPEVTPTEPTLGANPVSGLAALVASTVTGGSVVDQDGLTVIHATVTR